MAGVDAPYFGAPPLSEERLNSKGRNLFLLIRNKRFHFIGNPLYSFIVFCFLIQL